MKNSNIYLERNEFKRNKEKMMINIRIQRRIRNILGILGILFTISVANIYSAGFYNVGMKNKQMFTHCIYFVLGTIICFTIVNKFNYKLLVKGKNAKLIFLGMFTTLATMPILARIAPMIVPKRNGATAWINIPGVISIQPSEIFKIFFIVLVAHRLTLSEYEGDKNGKLLVKNLIIPIIFFSLIILQNDLGTVIHYLAIFLFMIFMSRIDGKIIARVVALVTVTIGGVFTYIYQLETEGLGYKIRRVKGFLNGLLNNIYDNDIGYQVGQSLIGLGNGGLIGTGYGNGIQKYSYLPEIHTDFIFASFGEEFGLLGVLLVIMLFWGLFNQIKSISSDTEDLFAKYLCIGVSGYIFTQFLINISVAIGLLPVFGIPMPIFSYGGSSLLGLSISMGIILNINKSIKYEKRDS